MKRAIIVVAGLAFMSTAHAADSLTGDQFKTIFATGKPIAISVPDGRQFIAVLNKDGTGTLTLKGDAKGTPGTWRSTASGYCTKWGSAGAENCFTARKAGDVYNVYTDQGKLNGTMKP
jgi:hypothetical protein